MRSRVALAAFAAGLAAAGVLLATGCGSEGTVTASPETVQGSLPTPTATRPSLPAFPTGDTQAGKSVFASAGCGGCHTLKAAGSNGNVGPNLDDAQPDVKLILSRVYLGQGAMPPFKGQLSLKEMADVAAYVYSSTHGGAQPPQSTETAPTSTTETTAATPTDTSTDATGGGAAAGNAAAGKTVFTSAGCAACHTLSAAGASGTVGPNLDDAQPDAALVVDRVTNGKGAMPPFKGQLSPQQIADVAAYVSQSTHS